MESELSTEFQFGLRRAISSYRSFQQADIPTDPKGFTAYHNACKAALLHIALLMKLLPEQSETGDSKMPDWIALAQNALKDKTEITEDEMFPD